MQVAASVDMIDSEGLPVVVGLGATGLSVVRHLVARGEQPIVVDSRAEPPGLEELRVELPQVPIVTGAFSAALLNRAAQLYVSPGIALEEPAVAGAIEAGVPVAGDIDLFVSAAKAPVVGITGSNAKSTVTELLGRMCSRAGVNAAVGGNLGTPALALLDDAVESYVLELSSFQLERSGPLNLALACILNLSPDHLDRHGDMAVYQRAKQRIFAGCQTAVFNRDDELTAVPANVAGECWSFGLGEPNERGFGLLHHGGEICLGLADEPWMPCSAMAMMGRHNIANALAALALGTVLGLSREAMLAELKLFTGLAHRCESVAEVAGVRFINDSKATNVGAACAALEGLAEDRNIVLIAGGQGKGADFDALTQPLAATCKAAVLIGEDAELLRRSIPQSVNTLTATSLRGAVSAATQLAAPGDIVLLSPACASFDMFRSFGDRGEQFRAAVLEHAAEVFAHG